MKLQIKKLLVAALLIATPVVMMAQPPHPNNGNLPGSSNTAVGGNPCGAPVGDGYALMLVLSAVYGALKIYRMRSATRNAEKLS